MEELVKVLKPLFEKLSDFFDIFDLSFFVSGFSTTLVIYVWGTHRNILPDIPLKDVSILYVVLICYILGIINFAFGRLLRIFISMFGKISNKFKVSNIVRYNKSDELVKRIISAHGLDNQPIIVEYLNRQHTYRGVWRFYVRLWARIRREEDLSNSFKLIKRYWVMAATYDGLSTTCFITCILSLDATYGYFGDPLFDNIRYGIVLAIIFFSLIWICKIEAKRYTDYQMEELIAVFADKQDLID
jgi:hypothetical protein